MGIDDRIKFSRSQQVLLEQLIANWKLTAQSSQRDAVAETDPIAKREMERKVRYFFGCAQELRQVLDTGDLPDCCGFQIRRSTC